MTVQNPSQDSNDDPGIAVLEWRSQKWMVMEGIDGF